MYTFVIADSGPLLPHSGRANYGAPAPPADAEPRGAEEPHPAGDGGACHCPPPALRPRNAARA